ncbi:cytochrome c-type biogenesis protein [Pseudomonas sp. HK3]
MMKYVVLFAALLLSQLSYAIVDGHEYIFDDGSEVENENRAQLFQTLAQELRCPKCQNQNLSDSNAMIAGDLRRELYQQVKSGQDGESIVNFMVNRYGEFVLYRPKVNGMTYVLWFGPVALLIIGLICLIVIVRKRKQSVQPAEPLSEAQQKRIDQLLAKDKGDDHV